MSDEIPQFETDPNPGMDPLLPGLDRLCVACRDPYYVGHGTPPPLDRLTGLCRPCWRVVILGPAMANQDPIVIMPAHRD